MDRWKTLQEHIGKTLFIKTGLINFGPPGEQVDLSGIKRYAHLEQMLNDPDIDLIDVCNPTHLHPQTALKALHAGKHVLVEKAIALTPEDADASLDADGSVTDGSSDGDVADGSDDAEDGEPDSCSDQGSHHDVRVEVLPSTYAQAGGGRRQGDLDTPQRGTGCLIGILMIARSVCGS